MLIKNISRKTVLSSEAIPCNTVFSRFLGLMFAKKPKALIFKFGKTQKISLHMFFVFFPIDVLFLDKQKKVVDMKESFKPFAFYISKSPAMYAIELPEGSIKKSKTIIGDTISLKG